MKKRKFKTKAFSLVFWTYLCTVYCNNLSFKIKSEFKMKHSCQNETL